MSCYLNFDPVIQKPNFRETLRCLVKEEVKGHLKENKSAKLLYAEKARQLPSIAKKHKTLAELRLCEIHNLKLNKTKK
jgi:hypothetical protein